MQWTNSPGQCATAAIVWLVPGMIWHVYAFGLVSRGIGPATAALTAGVVTAIFVAGVARPWVREQIIKAVFPDEREPPACAWCGSTECGGRDRGLELREVLG